MEPPTRRWQKPTKYWLCANRSSCVSARARACVRVCARAFVRACVCACVHSRSRAGRGPPSTSQCLASAWRASLARAWRASLASLLGQALAKQCLASAWLCQALASAWLERQAGQAGTPSTGQCLAVRQQVILRVRARARAQSTRPALAVPGWNAKLAKLERARAQSTRPALAVRHQVVES